MLFLMKDSVQRQYIGRDFLSLRWFSGRWLGDSISKKIRIFKDEQLL